MPAGSIQAAPAHLQEAAGTRAQISHNPEQAQGGAGVHAAD